MHSTSTQINIISCFHNFIPIDNLFNITFFFQHQYLNHRKNKIITINCRNYNNKNKKSKLQNIHKQKREKRKEKKENKKTKDKKTKEKKKKTQAKINIRVVISFFSQ